MRCERDHIDGRVCQRVLKRDGTCPVPEEHADNSVESCHCGRSIHYYKEMDNFTRDMCEECSIVRCDVDPEQCPYLFEKLGNRDPEEMT